MIPPVLVVEDDKKTVEILRLYLEKEGFQVLTASTGKHAINLFRYQPVSLIILDLMLPGLSGFDVCSIVREESDVPIIMLTAKATEDDKLSGLDLGADDYITKPFSPRELMARVRAVLRRTYKDEISGEENIIDFHDLHIDLMRHEVQVNNQPITLTRREFKLLEILASQPGRVYSRQELLERCFGYDYEGLERTVDAHVKNLRKKIEPDPAEPIYIQTVYGVGYKLTGR